MAYSVQTFTSTKACVNIKKNSIKPYPKSNNTNVMMIRGLSLLNSLSSKEKMRNKFFKISKGVQKEDMWRIGCNDDGSCGIVPQYQPPPSIEDFIRDFYKSINEKDYLKIEKMLSPDCQFQELMFYLPFQGKKEILNFLNNLMDAMGANVYFTIESIIEGDNCTASVIWHLEWNETTIPFTTGYSYFECENEDGKILIRKVRGVEELPVKLGDTILKLLKAATTVFDHFPTAAEGFLLKSHTTNDALVMLLNLLGVDRHSSS